ncbi:MAG: threonine/serine dehydratase [Candidatus Bathyarchaeota archaeon]|nr:threonine/serine dehydratase [Candidatus Bathyarchaeota archaeon]
MFRRLQGAYERLKEIVNITPVMTSRTLNMVTGNACFLKCENFQRTGTFKFRGAYNALSKLSSEKKKRGVITHSSGNHAQALALAAKLLKIEAKVVMPENTPPVKAKATREYGAKIVTCGSDPAERERVASSLVREHGYTFVHPSNNLDVIAGAGTAAYELVQQVQRLDHILCPVGGGGLLSGSAIAIKALLPSARIIGVEPKNADDAYQSFKSGHIIRADNPNTIADGLRTSLGSNTFRVIREKVDQIITVSEEEIVDAMQFLWERLKLVVEPSGAVSLAGLLSQQVKDDPGRKGVILSGGNIDLQDFFTRIRQNIEKTRTFKCP